VKLHTQQDREVVLAAIKEVADVVASTMGPKPYSVTIVTPGGGATINDGVQIVRSYQPTNEKGHGVLIDRDPLTDLGISRIKRACEATLRQAGDGTSTTAVLFAELVERAEKFIATTGALRFDVAERIEQDAAFLVEKIEKLAKPANTRKIVQDVAKIAMHGSAWATGIADLLFDLGKDGAFSVEVSKTGKFETEKVDGYVWKSGIPAECFRHRPGRLDVAKSYVAVIANEVSDMKQIEGVLEAYMQTQDTGLAPENWEPLIIVCPQMNGNARSTLLAAQVPHGGRVARAPFVIVDVPRSEDMYDHMRDLAALCQTTMFNKVDGRLTGKHDVSMKDLGTVERFFATDKTSTFIPANESAVNRRIEELEEARKEADGDAAVSIDVRLSRLKGKYGVIRIPIVTESEFGHLRELTEDGTRAVQSAMEYGVVPGGGWTLYWLAEKYLDQLLDCVEASLWQPRFRVKDNLGVTPDCSIDLLGKSVWQMPHIRIGDGQVDNALTVGIIDNAMSTKAAILNAAKEAAMMIRTKNFIVIDQRNKP
jgi:chaperonin GroEL